MRRLCFVAAALVAAGLFLLNLGNGYPVSTHPDAPDRVYGKVEFGDSREWYRLLRQYETPHKTYVDAGRGSCAAGPGLRKDEDDNDDSEPPAPEDGVERAADTGTRRA